MGEESESANSAARREPVVDDEEEEDDQSGQPQSISDLANQLFGDLAHEIEIPIDDEHTESTKTPSPSRDGASQSGAQSERSERSEMSTLVSEPATAEVVSATNAPVSGIRLLHQRRKERA